MGRFVAGLGAMPKAPRLERHHCQLSRYDNARHRFGEISFASSRDILPTIYCYHWYLLCSTTVPEHGTSAFPGYRAAVARSPIKCTPLPQRAVLRREVVSSPTNTLFNWLQWLRLTAQPSKFTHREASSSQVELDSSPLTLRSCW